MKLRLAVLPVAVKSEDVATKRTPSGDPCSSLIPSSRAFQLGSITIVPLQLSMPVKYVKRVGDRVFLSAWADSPDKPAEFLVAASCGERLELVNLTWREFARGHAVEALDVLGKAFSRVIERVAPA